MPLVLRGENSCKVMVTVRADPIASLNLVTIAKYPLALPRVRIAESLLRGEFGSPAATPSSPTVTMLSRLVCDTLFFTCSVT
jgi:hypothetical protein